MNKQQVITDIGIAVLGTICLMAGFSGDGYLSKLALVWGGFCIGYLLTVYLNIDEEIDE